MDLVYILLGFSCLGFFLYVIYQVTGSNQSNAPINLNISTDMEKTMQSEEKTAAQIATANLNQLATEYNSRFVKITQKLNVTGWLGVIFFIGSPIISIFMLVDQISQASMRYSYNVPNYSLQYLICGFLSLLGLIFIIIGRDFYYPKQDNQ